MSGNFFDKQPREIFHIEVTFDERLAIGETIVDHTITAVETLTGADKATEIIRDSAIDATNTKIDISVMAGDTGLDYKITALAETSGDNLLEEEVIMHIKEE